MTDKITNVTETLRKAQALIDEAKTLRYGYGIAEILDSIERLKVFGMEWGDQLPAHHHFRILKGDKYKLFNSATHYHFNSDTLYIHWDNGNVGAYQFVRGDKAYLAVQDEWNGFKDALMSYNPLDYDPRNCHIVFSTEDGKRLMDNYDKICQVTHDKMRKKIKMVELEDAKAAYEKLRKEVENDR